MKRLNLFLCAALAIAGVVSCEEDGPVDFPIVGDFTLTGESTNAATSSWYPGEQIGVFVTSDGVTQTNLLYAPSETCEDKSVLLDENDPTSKYWMFGDPIGNVTLNAKGIAAGFKQGVHNIYVYSPYNAAATDVTAIPMPDLTYQDATAFNGLTANPALSFVWASAEVSEFTSAPVDLGKFNSLSVNLNTGSISFSNESAKDKKLVKLVVTADQMLAYKNPTFNLVEGKINGEAAAVEIKTELSISANSNYVYDPVSGTVVAVESLGTLDGCQFTIVAPATIEELKTMKFNFKGILDDNSEWTASDMTPTVMDIGEGKYMVTFMSSITLNK